MIWPCPVCGSPVQVLLPPAKMRCDFYGAVLKLEEIGEDIALVVDES